MVDSSSDKALSSALSLLRVRGSVFGASELGAPWGVRTEALEDLACYVVVRGSAFLTLRDGHGTQVALAGGDVALVRAGVAHELKDSPRSRAVPFERLRRAVTTQSGPFRWGGSGPRTTVVCGALDLDIPDGTLIDPSLPAYLHLAAEASSAGLKGIVAALSAEVERPGLGSSLMLTRIAELLFLQVLRGCIEHDQGAVGWLRGLGHPALARAIACVHDAPGHTWTVDELAKKASMSRSTFAETFHRVVGATPLAYVTAWRMRYAARLLEEPERDIKAIARDVGYGSDEAFSRAFREWAGMPPGHYRRRLLGADADDR